MLQFAWAIIADIDFESERWRCCGGARFTWGGVVRAACLRKYSGRLWYLPAAAAAPAVAPALVPPTTGEAEELPEGERVAGAAAGAGTGASASASDIAAQEAHRFPSIGPPLSQPVPADWQVRCVWCVVCGVWCVVCGV